MGRALEKKKKEMERRFKNFKELSNCRDMDFPNNLTHICKINLDILNNYYEYKIKDNLNYQLKYDYLLITFIYNFLASIKSYLNRKKRDIEKRVPNENKKEILDIFEKYWKKNRRETIIDNLVFVRDKMEHENITSGGVLKRAIWQDRIEDHLLINNIEIIENANKAFKEINNLNNDIDKYIEEKLSKLKLRECSLFLNAFYRRFKNERFIQILPEETELEIETFNNEIEYLLKKDD